MAWDLSSTSNRSFSLSLQRCPLQLRQDLLFLGDLQESENSFYNNHRWDNAPKGRWATIAFHYLIAPLLHSNYIGSFHLTLSISCIIGRNQQKFVAFRLVIVFSFLHINLVVQGAWVTVCFEILVVWRSILPTRVGFPTVPLGSHSCSYRVSMRWPAFNWLWA